MSVMVEEYARDMIYTEAMHQDEVDKMLRKPGTRPSFFFWRRRMNRPSAP